MNTTALKVAYIRYQAAQRLASVTHLPEYIETADRLRAEVGRREHAVRREYPELRLETLYEVWRAAS